MNSKHVFLTLVLIAFVFAATAQLPPMPGGPFSIDRFCDPLTLAVARVDLSRLPPSDERASALLQRLAVFAEADGPLAPLLDGLKDAGVEEVYLVSDLADLGSEGLFFLVAPDRPDTRPGDVQALLEKTLGQNALFRGMQVTRARGALVAAHPRVWTRLRTLRSSGASGWASPFEAMRPGLLQVQFKPYDGWQRVVDELMPTLPEAVGGGPSTALTRGLKSASLVLDLVPEPALHLEVRSESGADAEVLRDVLLKGLETLGSVTSTREMFPDWPAVAEALTPMLGPKGLAWSLEGASFASLLETPPAGLTGQPGEEASGTEPSTP